MGTIFPLNRRRNKDELIQAKINRKEQNIDKWRDVYKKAWILLVLYGSVESSKLRFHEGLETKEYLSQPWRWNRSAAVCR